MERGVLTVLVSCLLVLPHVAVSSISLPQYLRCYGKPMDKVLCEEDKVISVYSAKYADYGALSDSQCSENVNVNDLCKEDIEDPAYYNEILMKCNGKQACENLVAGKADTRCPGLFNSETDYVLLQYTCEIVKDTTLPPGDPLSSTLPTDDPVVSTFSEAATSTVNIDTTPSEHEGAPPTTQTGSGGITEPQTATGQDLVIKIVVPVVVIILLIVIVIVCVVLKRKRRTSKHNKLSPKEDSSSFDSINHNVASGSKPDSAADDNGYIYDKAATVGLVPGGAVYKPGYVDMSFRGSKENSIRAPGGDSLEIASPKTKPESVYSLEKTPEGQESFYQSYEDDEAGPVPGNPNSHYVSMREESANNNNYDRTSELYSQVMTPSKLQDMEGVYSTPRNSGKVRSTSDSSGRGTDSVFDHPKSPPLEVTYENVAKESEESNSYRGYRPPQTNPRLDSSTSVTSNDLTVIDNANYAAV